MRAIMYRLKWEKYPNEPDKIMLPCEHFDLIGGSGTGGYAYPALFNQYSNIEQFDCYHVSEATLVSGGGHRRVLHYY
jgi:hypothetical protein